MDADELAVGVVVNNGVDGLVGVDAEVARVDAVDVRIVAVDARVSADMYGQFTLLRIIHLLVAASKSCAIGSHGDALPVDTMVETGDHDCIILGP